MNQSLRSEGITRGLLLDHLISECGCTVKRSKVSNVTHLPQKLFIPSGGNFNPNQIFFYTAWNKTETRK